LRGDLHKVQVSFGKNPPAADPYQALNVLHKESRGTVDLLIIRQPREEVERILNAKNPVLFDLLPLSLEEIFIYELGGEHDVESLLF
ncbi:MAG: ABC transporter ATP-binding protein, partial [Firmicutes bacterium]|nr:ABC transporter ATP-binding protein [Bacillota bacterium]